MTEAIVLVGGLGTRLRPLTIHTPKPMLPVAGVPLLTHQLARARDAGVDHVVLATSYRAEVFEGYFGDGSAFGLELEYAVEDAPLGTGGAIRNVSARLRSEPDDPVLVLNGDVLSGHDLGAQLAWHSEREADVTLHLVQVPDARAFGCVPTDASGRVTAFFEKLPEPVTNQINAGSYVFRRKLVDDIPPDRVVSVEHETFPALLAAGAYVAGFVDSSYWLDMGTPEAYVRGSRDLVLGRLRSSALPGRPGERLLLAGSAVAHDAAVMGGTTVGAGAYVGPAALVDGSVLLERAVVEAGATVRDSVIGVGARVGAGSELTGVVVGNGAEIGARNELRQGCRVWSEVVLTDGAVRFSSDI
jgi:mannose-1-phosphate guanylyltransferase